MIVYSQGKRIRVGEGTTSFSYYLGSHTAIRMHCPFCGKRVRRMANGHTAVHRPYGTRNTNKDVLACPGGAIPHD